ncbi:bleomycin hydrolase [Physocladia obscura]|uniref:Bleomycin hydrolase n=1 Tax=Physocladia obscura TaxID=109957 RepID=A0AAD5SQC1_9FUNG|nr:bleomycin hydrolase [Physocladia obscura]
MLRRLATRRLGLEPGALAHLVARGDTSNRAGTRASSSGSARPSARVVVVGAVQTQAAFELSRGDGAAELHVDAARLSAQLAALRFDAKPGSVRIVAPDTNVGADSDRPLVCVVGLGSPSSTNQTQPATATSTTTSTASIANAASINANTNAINNANTVRTAAAAAVKAVRALDPTTPFDIAFGPLNALFAKPAAEAALLTAYHYSVNKTKKSADLSLRLLDTTNSDANAAWHEGLILAAAQNSARLLMETPANLLTPSLFAVRAKELLLSTNNKNIQVNIQDQKWIEHQKMLSFLSVGRGSAEPPKFLEIKYEGNKETNNKFPLALVGKGVTFDSGGISIKPSASMADMKGDMGGAAVVVGAIEAIAALNLPINIIACIPLTENMPSGTATKPGDVVIARNGKSIEIDNTDAEGRLILADAISYVCDTYSPAALVELSTLTGAIDVALGYPYAGVFTTSDALWHNLHGAARLAGEGFWRMPMDSDAYLPMIKSNVADLKNVGGRSAGSCTAAVFLQEFVGRGVEFAHIDIAGVMKQTGSHGILARGMTGRPVRALVEFAKNIVLNGSKNRII